MQQLSPPQGCSSRGVTSGEVYGKFRVQAILYPVRATRPFRVWYIGLTFSDLIIRAGHDDNRF